MELRNLMEDEVLHAINKMKENPVLKCNCDKCKLDIAAIALNDLKSNYVVTKSGYLYAKVLNLNYQFSTDVVAAATRAMEIVGKNPQHEI